MSKYQEMFGAMLGSMLVGKSAGYAGNNIVGSNCCKLLRKARHLKHGGRGRAHSERGSGSGGGSIGGRAPRHRSSKHRAARKKHHEKLHHGPAKKHAPECEHHTRHAPKHHKKHKRPCDVPGSCFVAGTLVITDEELAAMLSARAAESEWNANLWIAALLLSAGIVGRQMLRDKNRQRSSAAGTDGAEASEAHKDGLVPLRPAEAFLTDAEALLLVVLGS